MKKLKKIKIKKKRLFIQILYFLFPPQLACSLKKWSVFIFLDFFVEGTFFSNFLPKKFSSLNFFYFLLFLHFFFSKMTKILAKSSQRRKVTFLSKTRKKGFFFTIFSPTDLITSKEIIFRKKKIETSFFAQIFAKNWKKKMEKSEKNERCQELEFYRLRQKWSYDTDFFWKT